MIRLKIGGYTCLALEVYKFIEVLKLLILVTHMYIFFTKERQNDINVFGTLCIHSSSSI